MITDAELMRMAVNLESIGLNPVAKLKVAAALLGPLLGHSAPAAPAKAVARQERPTSRRPPRSARRGRSSPEREDGQGEGRRIRA
jgi:hypothetical protein